jgi:hypothetical protein
MILVDSEGKEWELKELWGLLAALIAAHLIFI